MWLIAVTLRRRHCQALAGTLLYNISKTLAGTLLYNISKALAGTLVYNIFKALLGRLGAWIESEMSGVVSSLGGLDAEQQCKYIAHIRLPWSIG